MERSGEAEGRQPVGIVLLYALAYAGGVVAYTPFLLLALPARVAELGRADDIRWFGYMIFAGAVAASISGMASGWLSDGTRTRRLWVAVGLGATLLLMFAMPQCRRVDTLLWLVVAWQLALNLMLVPLIAWAGDFIPDGQKGLLGGMLAFAPAVGAWSGIAFAAGAVTGFEGRVAVIAGMTAAAVLPLLLSGPVRRPTVAPGPGDASAPREGRVAPAALRMWTARLLMQVSGVGMTSYLYFWLRDLDPAISDGEKTVLYAAGLTASTFVALALGHWSDRRSRPFATLSMTAAVTAAALIVMALVADPIAAKLAYLVFATAGAAFLALHSGQTLRVLRDPGRRGLGIGLFNLTNTAPSLIVPWIAILVLPAFGFAQLFLLLALLAAGAAALLATVPRAA